MEQHQIKQKSEQLSPSNKNGKYDLQNHECKQPTLQKLQSKDTQQTISMQRHQDMGVYKNQSNNHNNNQLKIVDESSREKIQENNQDNSTLQKFINEKTINSPLQQQLIQLKQSQENNSPAKSKNTMHSTIIGLPQQTPKQQFSMGNAFNNVNQSNANQISQQIQNKKVNQSNQKTLQSSLVTFNANSNQAYIVQKERQLLQNSAQQQMQMSQFPPFMQITTPPKIYKKKQKPHMPISSLSLTTTSVGHSSQLQNQPNSNRKVFTIKRTNNSGLDNSDSVRGQLARSLIQTEIDYQKQKLININKQEQYGNFTQNVDKIESYNFLKDNNQYIGKQQAANQSISSIKDGEYNNNQLSNQSRVQSMLTSNNTKNSNFQFQQSSYKSNSFIVQPQSNMQQKSLRKSLLETPSTNLDNSLLYKQQNNLSQSIDNFKTLDDGNEFDTKQKLKKSKNTESGSYSLVYQQQQQQQPQNLTGPYSQRINAENTRFKEEYQNLNDKLIQNLGNQNAQKLFPEISQSYTSQTYQNQSGDQTNPNSLIISKKVLQQTQNIQKDQRNLSLDNFKIEKTQIASNLSSNIVNDNKQNYQNQQQQQQYHQKKKNLQHMQGLSLTIIRNKQLMKKLENDMLVNDVTSMKQSLVGSDFSSKNGITYNQNRKVIHNQLNSTNNWYLLSLSLQYQHQEDQIFNSQFKNLGKGSNGSFYFNNNQNANPSLKKDLMGFLEIQKMTMPTKDQASYSNINHLTQQQNLQQYETIQQCPPVLPLNPNYLKFVVLPGNNSRLIKEAMLRRGHKWIETFAQDPFYHFKWQPVSYGIKFEQISTPIVQGMHPCQKQLVNHFEFHSNLTEKSKLFKNLTQYSIKLRENVFDYMPLTYFVEIDDIGKMKGYAKAMLPFMNSFYALEDIKKKTIKYYIKVDEMKGSSSPTKVNQFQQETTENADDPFDEQFIFKHFYNNKRGLIKQHLKEEKESKEKTLKKHFFKYTMPFCHFSGHNLWLLKPTKLNRGRGIHVYNNLGMLKTLIFKYCEGFKKQNQTSATMKQLSLKIQDSNNANEACSTIIGTNNALTRMKQQAINNVETSPDKQNMLIENSQDLDEEDIVDPMDDLDSSPTQLKEKVSSEVNPKTLSNTIDKKQSATTASQVTQFKHNSFILQKYIERPLLIHQRKFDIRVWVIINYDSSCYMFKEGYLRTSSSEYGIDPNNPDDQYVHLTNNAIQKFSDNYGNFEDGNQMSYDAFQQYLDDKGYSVNVKKDLVFRMKQLIVRSIFATKHSLDPKQRKSCFELFGYDFIIDEDFNLWLIEVNTNPCIEESSNILKIYLPRMIDDMLKLSVDQFYQEFNPQQYFQSAKNEYQTIDEGFEEQKYTFPVNGYNDDENMWEYMCNIKDKKNRKEAKDQYFTPIQINSKYAFQIKDRQFKVKKYIQEQMPPNLNNNQKSHTDLNQLQQDSKSDSLNEGA
eukprot:403360664